MAYSEARARASKNYKERRMTVVMMKFRKEEDADILENMYKASEEGINKIEWLRALINGEKLV